MERFRAVPPKVFALGAAITLLLIAGAAYAIASSGGSDSPPTRTTSTRTAAQLDVAPTATGTAIPAPTATPAVVAQPNRMDCKAITGSAYQSDDERSWYIQNCSSASGAPASASGPAPAPAAGQAPNGDRLVIPAAGVNADIWRTSVPASGQMPDPIGYFNALSYDFSAFGGSYGGTPSSGNLVLAGHVDCAHCYGGGSGTAVFWSTRTLKPGDTAQYISAGGGVNNYVVVSSQSYSPNTDWSSIVARGAADMTIITCTGTFSGGEYNLRHVVQFRKV